MRADREAEFTAMVDAGALKPRSAMAGSEDNANKYLTLPLDVMSEEDQVTAMAMLRVIEHREEAQKRRVLEFVEEVEGETGTSREYGRDIETWETLARKAESGQPLSAIETATHDEAISRLTTAFGQSGLIPVLQAWYGPALERRTALASSSAHEQNLPVSE